MKAILLYHIAKYWLQGISLCIVLLVATMGQSQVLFNVLKNGKPIGKIELYQQATANGIWYALKGDMKMNAIITIHIQFQQINYVDHSNRLTDGSYSRTMNPGQSKSTAIKSVPGGYTLTENNSKSNQLPGDIEFSCLQMYFKEPLNTAAIFSENHLQFLPLTYKGEGVYKLQTPDGYYTTYWFKQGKLQKVEGESRFGNVVFVRAAQ